MANITKMPKQFVGQLETKTITNPKLLTAIDADDSVIQLTQGILTADGNKPTDPFIIVIRNATTKYPETVYVEDPTTELSADGKTITLTSAATQRGIAPSPDDAGDVDFLSGTAARASAHPEGSEVRVSIHANLWAAMILALQGDIASGGATWRVGREIDEDIIWYAENGDATPPYFKYVSASNKFVVAADGVTEIDMASGGVTTAGDGIDITAAVISIDTADTNTFVKTSSGAADENKVPVLDASGDLAEGFLPTALAQNYAFTGDITLDAQPIAKTKFGGDGSDGDLTVSGDTTLNPTHKVFNYENLTIDAGFTLAFGANFQNKVVHIKVRNDCTINGTLSVKGAGSTGGGGSSGSSSTPSNGNNGNAINSDVLDALTHPGFGGNVGGTPAALTTTGIASIYANPNNKRIFYVIPGVGGGGGQGGFSNNGATHGAGGTGGTISATPTVGGTGANGSGTQQGGSGGGGGGGAGGGALILEVLGNLTIGASGVIDISGQAGSAGGVGGNGSNREGGSGGGGGGGGSGGMGIILYSGTLSNSGTITVAGGSGGAGGNSGTGTGDSGADQCAGGDGASGAGFYSGVGGSAGAGAATEANDGSPGGSGSGGGGGGGAAGGNSGSFTGGASGSGNASSGYYIIEKNVTFA